MRFFSLTHDLRARLARMSDAQLFELGQLHTGAHSARRPFRRARRSRCVPRRVPLLRVINHGLRRGFRTTKQRMRKHIQAVQPAAAVRLRHR